MLAAERNDIGVAAALTGLAVVAGAVAVARVLPEPIDWTNYFKPAAEAVLRGESPYVPGYYNPPWGVLPLLPIALMGQYSAGLLFMVSLVALLGTAIKLGATPLTALLFLSSPPVLQSLWNGQLEWLALLGLVLPPRWGLFFVVIKPHVAAGVVLFWLVEAWREGRLREVVHIFWPITVAYLASFALFGLWPLRPTHIAEHAYNMSIWPYGIPLGVGLLAWSIRKREVRLALAATPFFSWYVLQHAYTGVLMAGVRNKRVTVALVGTWWLLVLFAPH